ncbi:epoxide hydrolase, soluble (sEH) [Microbotryomycetes sp. JL221]|nr:epoxide hydrolase, soluble (sEH) [Microbotryomycetes sp. JL221]
MSTVQTGVSLSSHSDLITSLAFSTHPYLATASLDHTVRVASLNPATGQWDANAQDWKAHDAPVLKVAWAHPQYGVLLASGGVDGIIKLWAQEDSTTSAGRRAIGTATGRGPAPLAPSSPGQYQQQQQQQQTKRWTQRAALIDSRGTIRDLEFSPPEFGLKLASVSSDSHLRLWECLDPVSMSDWTLVEDIDLNGLPVQPSVAPAAGSMLASGPGSSGIALGGIAGSTAGAGGMSAGSGSFGFGATADHSSPAKGGFKSGVGSSGLAPSHAGLGSTGLSPSMASSAGSSSSFEGRKNGTVESDGGWSLSWCKEAWWGERLAVSAGTSGIIRLFHLPDHAPWNNYLNLLPPRAGSSFGATPPTSSLAWAPASGRSYQLLASGSRDGRARVWKLYPPTLEGGEAADVDGAWHGEMDAELEETKSGRGGSVASVRVEWNVTGTVLSTAGDDAKVRLWKSTYTGQWRPVAVLSTEDVGPDDQAAA